MKSILILIVLSLSNYSLAAVDKKVLKKHFEEADKLVSKVDILNLGTQCFDQNDDKKGLIVKTEVVAAKWPLFPKMKYDIVLGEYLSPTVTLEKGSTQYGDTDIITKNRANQGLHIRKGYGDYLYYRTYENSTTSIEICLDDTSDDEDICIVPESGISCGCDDYGTQYITKVKEIYGYCY